MIYHYTIEGKEFDLDEFTQGYLECALWSSNDESDEQGGNPLNDNYTIYNLSLDTMEKAVKDCRAFQADNAMDLKEAYKRYSKWSWTPEFQTGYDFWLTRNGHGVGFLDRGLGDVGDRLSDACKPYGSVYLYVGDDGRIYS